MESDIRSTAPIRRTRLMKMGTTATHWKTRPTRAIPRRMKAFTKGPARFVRFGLPRTS